MAYFSRAAFARRRVEAQFNHENLCPICDTADSSYVLSRGPMRLLRCQGCGLIRLEPRKRPSSRPDGQERDTPIQHLSDGQQAPREAQGEIDWQPLLEAVRSDLRRRGKASHTLQIGCVGTIGPATQAIAAQLDLRLVGIDPGGDNFGSTGEFPAERLLDACLIAEGFEREGDPLSTLLMVRRYLAPDAILALAFDSLAQNADGPRAQDLIAGPVLRFLYNRETAESLLFRAGFGRIAIARLPGRAARVVVTAVKRYPENSPRVRSKLSIIMPVFNEKNTFLEVFELIHAKQLADLDREIIIVESNSTDGTKDDVRSIADRPDVIVVWQQQPRGKGHAVREGLAHASGDFIIIQDADLEYDIEDYDLLLDPLLRNRAAFVLGIRHGRHGDSWKMRHFEDQFAVSQVMNIGHLFFTSLFNVVYGQRLSDPFTMFKVFRRDCIDGVAFECDRFDFDWELVAKLIRRGYVPVEIPVNYTSRSFAEGKKVTFFRDPITWLRACIKYRFVKV